ncbi:MAG: NVEALA domain-containing protein [Bacteroides sp.]|uniref:NVEALA domain-containing protein n=1 Tax=Bacteroides sp. TaxID=29523 RepID=UPI002FCC2EED
MKKKLFIVMVVVVAAMASILCVHRREQVKLMSDVMMANVEALAQYESSGGCAEWVRKNCYEVFSPEYGTDYYASCAPTTMGGMAECGAVESHKPAGMSKVNDCLQCIRDY